MNEGLGELRVSQTLFYQPCLDCGGSKDILDLRICGQQSVCGLSYEPASDCSAGI